MDLWNIKCLEPPSIVTYKTTSYKVIQQLRSQFKKALEYFNNQKLLEKEAALLSRCIYRMKTKFRSDKGLKSMEKLNRALLQFNYLNLSSILDDFYSLLPKERNEDLHLPTRNMLDFILIRLQGTAFLMCRVIDVAQIAASNMGSRICIGQFWKVALIMLGVVSRIWVICKDMLKRCCDFYRNVLPMRIVLKNISANWLSDDYVFPDNLEDSLDADITNIENKLDLGSFKSIVTVFETNEHFTMKEYSEYTEVEEENEETINLPDEQQLEIDKNNPKKMNTFDFLVQNEDFGELICESIEIEQQRKNVINISSDSEDGTNGVSQTLNSSNGNGKVIIGDDYRNKKRKRKQKINCNRKINNNELIKNTNFKENKQNHMENEKPHKNKPKNKANKSTLKNSAIENINSLKELKIFMITESKFKEKQNLAGIFGKIDKLQWNMLRKHIKKFMKRANNNVITHSQCLIEAKNVLKAALD